MSNTTNSNQRDETTEGRQAAMTAVFATVVMTGYLWTQIINGLLPPVV